MSEQDMPDVVCQAYSPGEIRRMIAQGATVEVMVRMAGRRAAGEPVSEADADPRSVFTWRERAWISEALATELIRVGNEHRADLAAAQAQVARLTAALEAINELRDGIIRTQTIGWSRTVYPLVKILNDAGILSRVTDDELAPVPPGNRLQRAALATGEPSAEPSTEE